MGHLPTAALLGEGQSILLTEEESFSRGDPFWGSMGHPLTAALLGEG